MPMPDPGSVEKFITLSQIIGPAIKLTAWRTAVTVITLILLTMSPLSFGQTPSKKATIRFLALGDSYTIGESVPEEERWPVQLANELRTRGVEVQGPEILAVTGWRTAQLKRAIDDKVFAKDYDLVSLLIGVNNQYQGRDIDSYKAEFEELLRTAIALAGNNEERVFVISIPDYGYTPFGEKNQERISKEIDAFNSVNERISKAYGVRYVYITDISRQALEDPNLIAEDGLHPSGKMYALWVGRIVEKLGLAEK